MFEWSWVPRLTKANKVKALNNTISHNPEGNHLLPDFVYHPPFPGLAQSLHVPPNRILQLLLHHLLLELLLHQGYIGLVIRDGLAKGNVSENDLQPPKVLKLVLSEVGVIVEELVPSLAEVVPFAHGDEPSLQELLLEVVFLDVGSVYLVVDVASDYLLALLVDVIVLNRVDIILNEVDVVLVIFVLVKQPRSLVGLIHMR